MPLAIRPWLLFSLLAGMSSLCTSVFADSKDPRAQAVPFDSLIARIREAESTRVWRRADWKDETIEAAVNKLVAAVKAATGNESLKLPVEFKEVSAERDARFAAFEGGLLRVERGNAHVAHARKSIFLVDGSIDLSHASDCIVIARGIVNIGHGNRNLVIAGHHVEVGFDGMDGIRDGGRPGAEAPPPKHGSLVMSGGSVDIAHAQGTVCVAPKDLEISHATQVSYLGSPNRTVSHEHNCTSHKGISLPIEVGPPATLPAAIFTVKQIVSPDDRAKQLITVERNGIEYVLRPGAKLVDEAGRPIPEWADWTVGFIAEGVVLFTNGKSDASVQVR